MQIGEMKSHNQNGLTTTHLKLHEKQDQNRLQIF
jgi:hypothetical protein